jgi:cystathionine beta-lyase/cystathionine gamma-synthase
MGENTGIGDAGLSPETMVVQTWPGRERGHRPLNAPLYLSSVWETRDLAEMASLFTRDPDRGFYTRFGHPTLRMAEEKLAVLEGAEDALLFASGMAAITTSLLAVLRSGDHVVAHRAIFGQTIEFLDHLSRAFGVEVDFVDATDPAQVERALRPRTRVVYLETPSNPIIDIQDIRAAAALAHAHGALVFVDSTFAGPLIQRPVELGADLSLQSASKSLAGHADLLAGSAAGSRALLAKIREMRVLTGPTLDPHACWLLLRGMQTLALRVRAQCETAWRVARMLEAHPLVETVRYPFLASHAGSAVARGQMSQGGSMVSFALKGGIESTRRFVEALEWIPLASSLGSVATTLEVPEELDWAAEELGDRTEAFALPPGLIRLSVGSEAADDVEREMQRGLEAAAAHHAAATPVAVREEVAA